MRAIIFGLPTFGILTALAAAGITEVEFNTSGEAALAQEGEEPKATDGATVSATNTASAITGQGALATRNLPPFLSMLLGALLTDPQPCGDPTCEACAVAEPADKATAPTAPGEVPEVDSRDARFDPLEAAQNMLEQVADGEVVAVSLVGITSTGAVTLIASESTGQTLNMLAQGIKVADGTLAPADPEDD